MDGTPAKVSNAKKSMKIHIKYVKRKTYTN